MRIIIRRGCLIFYQQLGTPLVLVLSHSLVSRIACCIPQLVYPMIFRGEFLLFAIITCSSSKETPMNRASCNPEYAVRMILVTSGSRMLVEMGGRRWLSLDTLNLGAPGTRLNYCRGQEPYQQRCHSATPPARGRRGSDIFERFGTSPSMFERTRRNAFGTMNRIRLSGMIRRVLRCTVPNLIPRFPPAAERTNHARRRTGTKTRCL